MPSLLGGPDLPALFSPDIFSDPQPRFYPVPAASATAPLSAIRHAFQARIGLPSDLSQSGGNEINSNNFKVVARNGIFLLKRFPSSADDVAVARQLELLDWLAETGAPVPPLVRSDKGERMVRHEEAAWCAFEFVEGPFFSGAKEELRPLAMSVGQFHRLLNNDSAPCLPPKKWTYFSEADMACVEEAGRRRPEWPLLFGEECARWLEAGREVFEGLYFHVNVQWLRPREAACHCDLHPHNVLIGPGIRPVIIDLESLVLMPQEAALGFATYKLLKQHSSKMGLSYQQAKSAARSFMYYLSQGLDRSVDAHALRLGALAELLRRIVLVLRLNLHDRNTRWNHVLPMHFAGLREIPILFDT